MVSLEAYRTMATVYAGFSIVGTLLGMVAPDYSSLAYGQEKLYGKPQVPPEGFYNTDREQESPYEVVNTFASVRNSSTLYVISWSVASIALDVLLIRGIKTLNALFVQIKRVYFIITSILALVVMLLIAGALWILADRVETMMKESSDEKLRFFQQNFKIIMITYGVICAVVIAIYVLIYWILTGLVHAIREHERMQATGGEAFQSALVTGNCANMAAIKNQNNEFDV